MTVLVVLTVLEIVVLIAALAFYLFWVGTLLARIAGNLEECAEIVRGIVADAALIGPGVEHINETGGVVAGALPLLYGMAEEIVADVTPRPEPPAVPEPARPASGTRRSRLHDAVGFAPRLSRTDRWRLPRPTGPSRQAGRRQPVSRAGRKPLPVPPPWGCAVRMRIGATIMLNMGLNTARDGLAELAETSWMMSLPGSSHAPEPPGGHPAGRGRPPSRCRRRSPDGRRDVREADRARRVRRVADSAVGVSGTG